MRLKSRPALLCRLGEHPGYREGACSELMPDPTDAPSLLNRAGFTLTTVDVEDLTIRYPSVWELMADLRDMGESNAILGRRAFVARDVLLAADGIYKGEQFVHERSLLSGSGS